LFEIGNSLREARVRRGIDFAQAELATKVRGKYLRALEEEHFEVLPAETYVKGFLRTYAEYLGLDGQLYVDEYNSRFVIGEEQSEARARRSAARPQRRHRRIETNVVLGALAAIAILMVIVISAWKASSKSPSGTPTTTVAKTSTGAPAPLLSLRAVRGSSRVTARKNNATGDIVFDGTMQRGDQSLRLEGKRLWVYVSSPENLRIVANGHTVVVRGLRPRVAVVTKTGWHTRS
jgi:cytoskeletal protein RodZ